MSCSIIQKFFVKLLLIIYIFSIVNIELVATKGEKGPFVYNVQIYQQNTQKCLKVYSFERDVDRLGLFYFNQTHVFMQESPKKLSFIDLVSNQTRLIKVNINFYFLTLKLFIDKNFLKQEFDHEIKLVLSDWIHMDKLFVFTSSHRKLTIFEIDLYSRSIGSIFDFNLNMFNSIKFNIDPLKGYFVNQ